MELSISVLPENKSPGGGGARREDLKSKGFKKGVANVAAPFFRLRSALAVQKEISNGPKSNTHQ
jgi:hypothetical protein